MVVGVVVQRWGTPYSNSPALLAREGLHGGPTHGGDRLAVGLAGPHAAVVVRQPHLGAAALVEGKQS